MLTPAGAMHGGAALAATVEALEVATSRPLVWATAHYLTHVGPRGLLDVDVSVEVAGHQTTQARAVLRVDDVEVLLTVASLGTRDATSPGRWVQPAQAPVRPTPRLVLGVPDFGYLTQTEMVDAAQRICPAVPDNTVSVDGHDALEERYVPR